MDTWKSMFASRLSLELLAEWVYEHAKKLHRVEAKLTSLGILALVTALMLIVSVAVYRSHREVDRAQIAALRQQVEQSDVVKLRKEFYRSQTELGMLAAKFSADSDGKVRCHIPARFAQAFKATVGRVSYTNGAEVSGDVTWKDKVARDIEILLPPLSNDPTIIALSLVDSKKGHEASILNFELNRDGPPVEWFWRTKD